MPAALRRRRARAGTGRLGRSGRVVSLLAPQERNALGLITRALGISIRPDPELALALAQPGGSDAGAGAAPPRAEPARPVAAAASGDTPWDLPEAGDGW